MKACPVCAEQIQDAAIRCRFCGENLSGSTTPESTNTRSYTPKLRSVLLGILVFTLVFVTSGVFYTSHKKAEALKQKAVKFKQDQQNVLAQFSKLESSLTVGVNYGDFGHYLQEQQIAIDQFNTEHKDEKDAEQFVQAVQGVQQFFKDSQKFWAVKFETDQYLRPDAQHYPDSIQSSYFKVQLEQYPELRLLKEEIEPWDNPNGRERDNPYGTGTREKIEAINVDSARQILWAKATSRLTEIRDWLRSDMKTPLPAPSTASEINPSQSGPSSSPTPSASPVPPIVQASPSPSQSPSPVKIGSVEDEEGNRLELFKIGKKQRRLVFHFVGHTVADHIIDKAQTRSLELDVSKIATLRECYKTAKLALSEQKAVEVTAIEPIPNREGIYGPELTFQSYPNGENVQILYSNSQDTEADDTLAGLVWFHIIYSGPAANFVKFEALLK
jgi:hypothetical protein